MSNHREVELLDFGLMLDHDQCLCQWRVKTPWGNARLHHWLRSDRREFTHDHVWNFVTFIIRGGYVDISVALDGSEVRERLVAGDVRYRAAEHEHRVEECEGCWTLVLTGPKIRPSDLKIAGVVVDPIDWFKAVCS